MGGSEEGSYSGDTDTEMPKSSESSAPEDYEDDIDGLEIQLSRNCLLASTLRSACEALARLILHWLAGAGVGLGLTLVAVTLLIRDDKLFWSDAGQTILGMAATAGVLIVIVALAGVIRARSALANSRIILDGNRAAIEDGRAFLNRWREQW